MKTFSNYFNVKNITKNAIVIMGRNTWESLPIKPLPNRLNVIITTNILDIPNNVLVYNTFVDAIQNLENRKQSLFTLIS